MKKSKTPIPVTILLFTVITIVSWVVFSIYRAFTIKPAPAVPPEILEPLSATLDLTSLNKIQQRINLREEEIGNNEATIQTNISPLSSFQESASPSASPSPIATPSPTTTPIATQGGTAQ